MCFYEKRPGDMPPGVFCLPQGKQKSLGAIYNSYQSKIWIAPGVCYFPRIIISSWVIYESTENVYLEKNRGISPFLIVAQVSICSRQLSYLGVSNNCATHLLSVKMVDNFLCATSGQKCDFRNLAACEICSGEGIFDLNILIQRLPKYAIS